MRWYQRLFRRARTEKRLDAELRFHLEQQIADYIATGMAPEEARRRARLEFGGLDQVKEECRDVGAARFLETLIQDVRYALRQLRRNPGFTSIAVITLALGIGANTAIFSLVDTVLLKMLPVRKPEQLVWLTWVAPNYGGDEFFSYPAYELLANYNKTLSGVIAFHSLGDVDLVINGQAALARGQAVSGNYFTMLGVKPVLGRTLLPQDDAPNAGNAVAVISYGYWTTRFDRSRSVIGKAVTLNGTPITVVGVTPPEFFGLDPGEAVDISIPLGQIDHVTPGWAAAGSPYDALKAPFRNWLRLMARVREGVSRPFVLANLQPIYKEALRQASEGIRGLPIDTPESDRDLSQSRLRLAAGSRGLVALRRQFSKPLFFLLIVVGILLLIACTNVANLLLARASTRQREVALRMALGAGRLRVMRQLLTESVLISVAGGVFGMTLAYWGSGSLVALMSHSQSSIQLSVRPDARVLAFTAIVSFLAAIVFGFAPAWRVSHLELSRAVKDREQAVTGPVHRLRLGDSLVITQIALSLVLLTGAGLVVRTLENLRALNPGFDQQNILLFSLKPGMVGYTDSQVAQLYEEVSARIKAMPGVRTVSYSDFSPLAARFGSTVPVVQGYTPRPGENVPVNINYVSPGFFKTLRTVVLLGREFKESDRIGSPRVAIINEAMAHHYFGDSNPLGRTFSIPDWVGDASEIGIVGVAQNTKVHDLRERPVPTAYMPLLQEPDAVLAVTFEVRTASNPGILASSVRRLIEQTDSRIPLFDVKTLGEQVNESLVQERAVASLSSLFGVLALFLTCVGLYGLIAYSVTRRTHEIGIRMALGAQSRQVFGLVLSRGMILTLIGIGVGGVAALGLTRLMATLLYGVKPGDPLTFAAVALIIIAVALLACYIPARRAARVDPMEALRHE
jgi:predicted permease